MDGAPIEAGATESYEPFVLSDSTPDLDATQQPSPFDAPAQNEAPSGVEQPQAPEPAPTAPAAPQPDPRLERLEAQYNQLLGAVAPLVRPQQTPQQKRLTEEDLNAPDANVGTLVAFLRQELAEAQGRLMSQVGSTASRVASEQRWRGQLSGDSLGGAERSYDHMIGKYVNPVYDRNPVLRQMIDSETFGDPALAEYGIAALLRFEEYAKGDPVKAYRAMHDFLDGKGQADVAEQIVNVAKGEAKRIAGPASATRVAPLKSKPYTPGMFSGTSDDEFAKLDAEIMGS